MSVNVDKYVDLLSRYAIYGENGYYVDCSCVIHKIIVDELKLSMSFNEIVKFINTCEISIKESEIKEFLDKKMDEEEPSLRKQIEGDYKTFPKDLTKITEEDIENVSRRFAAEILKGRYVFEPYSLEYFKIYTSILKEKCKTLFDILDDLDKIKRGTISENGLNRIIDLDFHINKQGNIYIADMVRLADAIIYNVKDLYDKITIGNNPETYLTFKELKDIMDRDGIFENELYPRKEIQIKSIDWDNKSGFIALSDGQREKLKQEYRDLLSKMVEEDFSEDDYNNHVLEKTIKDNN